MDEDLKDPKQYELGVLLRTEADVPAILAFLTQHGATVLGTPSPKKIALAYPVKKTMEAIFVSCLFSSVPQNAKALEKDLGMRPEVLRSILIANPPAEEKRQPGFDAALPRRRTSRPPFRPSAPLKGGSAVGEKNAERENKPVPSGPLSNEALEKKIEEILK